MKLILMRHGETEGNHKGIYQGKIDYPLSEKGISQNIKLKEKLKEISIDRIYHSSLKRARDTAYMVFQDKGYKKEVFIEESNLNEIDFGSWEDKDYNYISQNCNTEFQSFIDDFKGFTFPEGESFKSFYSRIDIAVKELIKSSRNEDTIAIVAHGGTIRAIICSLLQLGEEYFYKFNVEHGCYSVLSVYEGSGVLEKLNI